MPKFIDRTGEKYITNEGYEIEIIECFNKKNCTILFKNGVIIKNRQYKHIKNGQIKNPYHKSVFGVGFMGVGKYNYKSYPKIYNTWHNMIKRCYDKKYHIKKPTYRDIKICEEWHNYQNFAKWYESNYIHGFEIDKDIICKECKIYSPITCMFIPQEINNLLIKSNSIRGKYPIGVSKYKDKFQASIKINSKRVFLGHLNTPEEAFQVYKMAKEAHIKKVADKWKDSIAPKIYQILYEYKVEITD